MDKKKKNEQMPLRHSENYFIRVLLNNVQLKDIMVEDVISIGIDEPFSHVAEKFHEFKIRHLPVVDINKKLTGIITQRDLYRVCPPRKREDGTWFHDKQSLDNYVLKHVMIKEVETCYPHEPVSKALLLMADKKYGSVPIVDNEKTLCGIVTQTDILRIAAKILREGENNNSS